MGNEPDFDHYYLQLLEKILHTAEWREGKAEEYPDDDRNEDAVMSLGALAKKFEALDLDDSLFLEYAGFFANEKYEDHCAEFIGIESEALKRVGFHHDFETAEEFLGHLIQAFRGEVKTMGAAL